VHVDSDKETGVLTSLDNLIDPAVKTSVESEGVGVVAFAAVKNPDEVPLSADPGYDISLFADQQLKLLANIAGKTWVLSDITDVSYSGVTVKKVTVELANGKKINVISSSFVK
jgi:hypothetical protein